MEHQYDCPQHVSSTVDTTISVTEPGSGKPTTRTFNADRKQVERIFWIGRPADTNYFETLPSRGDQETLTLPAYRSRGARI